MSLETDITVLDGHVSDLENENADLRQEIKDLRAELALISEHLNVEALRRYAEELSTADYYAAEIMQVSSQTWGAQIVIDVLMTPGEAMHVLPGHRWTLSAAEPSDFAAVAAEV